MKRKLWQLSLMVLPGTFYQLAKAGGHDVEVQDAFTKEPWDFVMLQENTNSAVDGENSMYPYARELDVKIKQAAWDYMREGR